MDQAAREPVGPRREVPRPVLQAEEMAAVGARAVSAEPEEAYFVEEAAGELVPPGARLAQAGVEPGAQADSHQG